jgi:DNA-binding HxlR family transcriptional regulator
MNPPYWKNRLTRGNGSWKGKNSIVIGKIRQFAKELSELEGSFTSDSLKGYMIPRWRGTPTANAIASRLGHLEAKGVIEVVHYDSHTKSRTYAWVGDDAEE